VPMARTRRGRVRQVARWLADEFPTPLPVEIKFVAKCSDGAQGECYRRGRRVVIEIRSALTWHFAIECLLHEWAHAMGWTFDHVEERKVPHDAQWGIHFAEVWSAFYDFEGWKRSREY